MASFKVGFRRGMAFDPRRHNWSNDGPRPIQWSVWYPADAAAIEQPIRLPIESPLFIMGSVAEGAALSQDLQRFPVILLSHGTGGTASSLGWIAQRIAAAGFIVIGVDHHGNTASQPYLPEGFLCWWERAPDLSVVLDTFLGEGAFVGRLDAERVSSLGFSLGGYTVLSLSGAITDMKLFAQWTTTRPSASGPREFPDIGSYVAPLLQTSSVFRASWERQSAPYYDDRVKKIVALAPAPPVRSFLPDSLSSIKPPVTIVVGGDDIEAPADLCSAWLHDRLPNSTLTNLGRGIGHYTLLCEATEAGKVTEPEIYGDPLGVDRLAVHDKVAQIVIPVLTSPSGR